MIKNQKLKLAIKKGLIGLNILLGLILFCVVLFWFLSIRPGQMNDAIALGQYRTYSIYELPFDKDEVQVNYNNANLAVSDITEEIALIEKEISAMQSNSESDVSELEDKELLSKIDSLLTQQEAISSTPEIKKIVQKSNAEPKIAIIITNLGLNKRSTELAMTLPEQCGLGFLPYTKNLKPLLDSAQNNGHEIFLYLPFQTSKSSDHSGRYDLMEHLSVEENMARLHTVLNAPIKYQGVYSSYKEIFTENVSASKMILDYLQDKNLMLVLGRGVSNNRQEYIDSYNSIIPTNIIIDKEPDRDAIAKQLAELVRTAEDEGVALGYAQGFTLTIGMLRDWIPTLKKKNIKLIPVSGVLKRV